jgi:hypothetical protein
VEAFSHERGTPVPTLPNEGRGGCDMCGPRTARPGRARLGMTLGPLLWLHYYYRADGFWNTSSELSRHYIASTKKTSTQSPATRYLGMVGDGSVRLRAMWKRSFEGIGGEEGPGSRACVSRLILDCVPSRPCCLGPLGLLNRVCARTNS